MAGHLAKAPSPTLSRCDVYTDNQTGEPNAAANGRQKRVKLDFHAKSQRLDRIAAAMKATVFKPGSTSSAKTAWF
jgi:hypothetical protein